MTLNEIKKKYNSKITVKEVHPFEILITGFDETNGFDRKVVAKTCKLSSKGYHVDIARIVVLRKRGYIVDDQITLVNPLTKVGHKVNVYTDKGMEIVNSMFRKSS